ncbi:uncharacterized protein SCHCODRAFT_02695646 [Schizophyllum commune H4-8]|nr:uncharacterized protein SCHCODRAFT_02695646 [Schizophyllum commune H4-8]KAI5900433.1 hypothetical protein SCHCODRAFT_02695646 [Schizophyllum commune H4-8]
MTASLERPSPAQECPEDVLHEILKWVDALGAAACAVVCRNWYLASRMRLYSSIKLDTSDVERMSSLLWTLVEAAPKTSLAFVRDVYILYERNLDKVPRAGLFSFLYRLPSIHNLLSLRIWLMTYDFDFAEAAFAPISALRSLKSITLEGKFLDLAQAPNRNIFTLISSPSLRRAHLEFGAPSQFNAECDVPTNITWLTVEPNSFLGWFRRLANPSLTKSLTRLDIIMSVIVNKKNVTVEPLRLFTRLTHLVIKTDVGGQPLLHEVVGHMPALRALYAGWGTWNERLYDVLPPALHSLWLDVGNDSHSPRLSNLPIERFAQHGLRALAIVCTGQDAPEVSEETASALDAGLIFRVYKGAPPDVLDERLLMQPDGEPIGVSPEHIPQ